MKKSGKATVEVQGAAGWDKKFKHVKVCLEDNRVEITLDEAEVFSKTKTRKLNFPAWMCVIFWEE